MVHIGVNSTGVRATCTDVVEVVRVLDDVDHILYAVPDLEAAVNDLGDRLGVRPSYGGRHPGRGTWNALLDLGSRQYLEVIAPDPEASGTGAPFGLDTLTGPRVLTWAIATQDLDARVRRARQAGYDPGNAEDRYRDLPDGSRLQWRLASNARLWPEVPGDGLVPFLIDWGDTPHPSLSAPRGVILEELTGAHPNPSAVERLLRAVGVDMKVDEGPRPMLTVRLTTPNGVVELV